MIYGQNQQVEGHNGVHADRDAELLGHIKEMINHYQKYQREAEKRGDRANAYRLDGAMGALSDLRQQMLRQ